MVTKEQIQILLIEDEAYDVRRVENTIKPVGHLIKIRDVAANGPEALELLIHNRRLYDVVILDFQIAGGLMGEALIRKIKEIDSALQIIVVTKMTINVTDFDFANNLLEAGAMWYCTKYPGDIENYIYQPTDFILSIFNAYEKRKLEIERQKSRQKIAKNIQDILDHNLIIGNSAAMTKLRQEIQKLAAMEAPVLIRGTSGTGKELVATNIHYHSKRKQENFVPINCGSIPAELVESEIFGYEKGAFTGATTGKAGLFEVANKGSVFLDEIAELPLPAQVKLLRVLQEGEIDKIGRTEKIKVDVRIIAASNKDIEKEVRERRFREDLYYRLNVVSITVPTLGQRPEDIPPLTDYFMKRYCKDMGREELSFDSEALDALRQYDWPGNVRELQNVIQRLLFTGEKSITARQIQMALGMQKSIYSNELLSFSFVEPDQILPLKDVEKRFRQSYFNYVRKNTQSDAEAARKLGLAPPNYHRMCKELGLK